MPYPKPLLGITKHCGDPIVRHAALAVFRNKHPARPRGHMELQDSRAQKPQIKIPASVPRDIVQIVLVRQRQAFT